MSIPQFDESWRALCECLDESMVTLDRYLTPNVSIVKQDIDELKVGGARLCCVSCDVGRECCALFKIEKLGLTKKEFV